MALKLTGAWREGRRRVTITFRATAQPADRHAGRDRRRRGGGRGRADRLGAARCAGATTRLGSCPATSTSTCTGAVGRSAIHPTPTEVAAVASFHARHGTTGLLATTVAAPVAELEAALRASGGAGVLGAHSEGPFMSNAWPGAMDPDVFLDPEPGVSGAAAGGRGRADGDVGAGAAGGASRSWSGWRERESWCRSAIAMRRSRRRRRRSARGRGR